MGLHSRTRERARSSPLPKGPPVVVLAFAGTRPEVLKLAPIVVAAKENPRLSLRLCFSGQQGELAQGIARELGISPDYDLPHEGAPKTLSLSMGTLMARLDGIVDAVNPHGIVVQGDTTTAVAGSFIAFHRQLPSFHVEAGLRTDNPHRPFPEEMNRRLITRLSTVHFAPTEHARSNLLAEGVAESRIFVTGNTIVDTLKAFGRNAQPSDPGSSKRSRVVVTLHRRENAEVVHGVVSAIRTLSTREDVEIIWVSHPNATGRAVIRALSELSNVRLVPPHGYKEFVSLLSGARAVLTDSGGVQEEAPVLGVPVVVLRRETDRPEAIGSGNAVLAGTDADRIVEACEKLLDDPEEYARRSQVASPFGDGRAGPRICEAIERHFHRPSRRPPPA